MPSINISSYPVCKVNSRDLRELTEGVDIYLFSTNSSSVFDRRTKDLNLNFNFFNKYSRDRLSVLNLWDLTNEHKRDGVHDMNLYLDILGSRFHYLLRDLPPDGSIEIGVERAYRPDLVSWDLYQSVSLSTLLMEYNLLYTKEEWESDVVVFYPSLSSLSALLDKVVDEMGRENNTANVLNLITSRQC
jgi:hypothetical protein